MVPFLRFGVAALLFVAGGFVAHAQQGGNRPAGGGGRLKREGRVSARLLREDERAERTKTVRSDGRMHEKPGFIREEDKLARRQHPQRALVPPAPARPKGHTTLKG